MFRNRVKNRKEFVGRGDEGDLFEFAALAEIFVEGADERVMEGGGNGSHVEDATDLIATAFAESFAYMFAAFVGKGSDADKRGDLFV